MKDEDDDRGNEAIRDAKAGKGANPPRNSSSSQEGDNDQDMESESKSQTDKIRTGNHKNKESVDHAELTPEEKTRKAKRQVSVEIASAVNIFQEILFVCFNENNAECILIGNLLEDRA